MMHLLSPEMMMGVLPLIGISLKIKEDIRKQHPEYGKKRIECAHVTDAFLGGTGKRENLIPLSIPEHILDHVVKAESTEDWDIAQRQYGAAHLIAKRATPQEIEEANQLLEKRKR